MGFRSRCRSGGGREFFFRLLAAAATLCGAIVMGLNKQTIYIYGISLQAKYYYSPAFTFFVVANATAGAYALLSVPISCISHALPLFSCRKRLFFFDLLMTIVVTAGASAGTAIAYVGYNGNTHAGWMKICDKFQTFCHHVEGALFASFMGLVIFIGLTAASVANH